MRRSPLLGAVLAVAAAVAMIAAGPLLQAAPKSPKAPRASKTKDTPTGEDRAALPKPPSILLVTIDTLRADRVGCYGHEGAITPNLDALASQGVRFLEARSSAPLTLPSHATLMTGLLPPHHKVRGNDLFRLDAAARTLAEALGEAGFATGAVVASAVLDRIHGLDRGFGAYDDNQRVGNPEAFGYVERGASQISASAERVLDTLEPPFFFWAHLYDPHHPWIAPQSWRERAVDAYDAEIAFADDALGMIVAKATERSNGRLVVVATSDHGESLGAHGEEQHGYTLHRGVQRVPLIMRGPGIPAGRTVPQTTSLADVAATIAELAGASLGTIDGTSLQPYWGASQKADRLPGITRAAKWEETLHPLYDAGWAPLRGMLTGQWHFVEAPRPELYDRLNDPDDTRNLAAEKRDVLRDLRDSLRTMSIDLGDTTAEPPPPAAENSDDPANQADQAYKDRLASLGYLSSAGAGSASQRPGGRLDPKDGLAGFRAIAEAARFMDAGRFKAAVDHLAPFVKKDPTNPRLLHKLGLALAGDGRLDESARVLDRALKAGGGYAFIRLAAADVALARGQTTEAKGLLESVLADNPRAVDASLRLAALESSTRNYVVARRVLRSSYSAGVRDPDLIVRLAYLEGAAGRENEAQKLFGLALDLDPSEPSALLETARAALRSGEASRAIPLLERCSESRRAFACRMELARAHLSATGDVIQARLQLEAARRVAATNGERAEVNRRIDEIDPERAERAP